MQTDCEPPRVCPSRPAAVQPAPGDAALRRAGAEGIIKSHIIAGMSVSLLPLPLIDTAALIKIQMNLIGRLAEHYAVPVSRAGRRLAVSVIAGSLPVLATGLGLSLFKVVPGFGSLTGAGTLSTLSAAMTLATGTVFVEHFESGGTFDDLDREALRPHLRRELRRSWRLAGELAFGVPL
jgi:uncharacterized protein (DUF697 family)